MHELIPFAIGVIIGLVVQQIASPRRRTAALVALCLFGGVLASYINGELSISWFFITFDVLLVWGGALGVMILSALWQRRSALR
jgi:peptidoglycan/LPS O-acetylase OafA/YrhL